MRNLWIGILVAAVIGVIAFFFLRDRDEDEDDDRGQAAAAVAPAEPPAAQQPTGTQLSYNFDSDPTGAISPHFHAALTGGGPQPSWIVQPDATAPSKPNVLSQTSSDRTDYRFPLAVADDASFRDLSLKVKFKAISGEVDRAAGLVFRLKNAANYYVVRANALEDNFNFYKVVNGRRSEITGSRVKVTSGDWHQIEVEAVGNKITCYYDGGKKIEITDDTFKEAGKIGLWTKADSVTSFDDLIVTAK